MTTNPIPDQPIPETETDKAESRGRGRPTNAELDARKNELDAREAALAAAEENFRHLQEVAQQRGLSVDPLSDFFVNEPAEALRAAPGRSGSARSDTIRSEDITVPVRQRRYRGGEMPNEFHIPPEQIPPGTSYQWNNHTVFGQENHSYSAHMAMQGWEPVPASRHPHLVPKGHTGPIIVKGQILMERPQELTNEALQEELDKARGEVRAKEEQLYGTPQGTLPRSRANGTNEFNTVKHDYERPQYELPRGQYKYDQGGGPVIE